MRVSFRVSLGFHLGFNLGFHLRFHLGCQFRVSAKVTVKVSFIFFKSGVLFKVFWLLFGVSRKVSVGFHLWFLQD